MKTPSEHLNTLRELHRGLSLKIDRRLALGGQVSAFEAARNADEIESLSWAIGTLRRLLKKAREQRAKRETGPASAQPASGSSSA